MPTESQKDAKQRRWVTSHTLKTQTLTLDYEAQAGFVDLYEEDKPVAEMFYVAYLVDSPNSKQPRPITFVFNGGPGASAAFLHVGALGPRRIAFGEQGQMPPAPPTLVDNEETWLPWTDLVFLDPVGTGWSRAHQEESGAAAPTKDDAKGSAAHLLFDGGKAAAKQPKEAKYWSVKQDLNALCETISRLLSRLSRWDSPVFIAGESYGGFRVARLVRQLQEEAGVGLRGAILISPAIDFENLYGTDTSLFYWVDQLPTMAAAAYHHEKAQAQGKSAEEHRKAAEAFAMSDMLQALAAGDSLPEKARNSFFRKVRTMTGLPADLIERNNGRISMEVFTKELLREQRKVLGLYDASMTAYDAFPDRKPMESPDPSLAGIMYIFNAAIQHLLGQHLGISLERSYLLINFATFESWKNEEQVEMQQGYISASDHFRYGLFMNDSLRVLISHGIFDLVTPYFASDRLISLMRLPEEVRRRIQLQHFSGGHMFYTWSQSRKDFRETANDFYQQALSGSTEGA